MERELKSLENVGAICIHITAWSAKGEFLPSVGEPTTLKARPRLSRLRVSVLKSSFR